MIDPQRDDRIRTEPRLAAEGSLGHPSRNHRGPHQRYQLQLSSRDGLRLLLDICCTQNRLETLQFETRQGSSLPTAETPSASAADSPSPPVAESPSAPAADSPSRPAAGSRSAGWWSHVEKAWCAHTQLQRAMAGAAPRAADPLHPLLDGPTRQLSRATAPPAASSQRLQRTGDSTIPARAPSQNNYADLAAARSCHCSSTAPSHHGSHL